MCGHTPDATPALTIAAALLAALLVAADEPQKMPSKFEQTPAERKLEKRQGKIEALKKQLDEQHKLVEKQGKLLKEWTNERIAWEKQMLEEIKKVNAELQKQINENGRLRRESEKRLERLPDVESAQREFQELLRQARQKLEMLIEDRARPATPFDPSYDDRVPLPPGICGRSTVAPCVDKASSGGPAPSILRSLWRPPDVHRI